MVEALGALLIVCALVMVSIPLAVFVAGAILVAVANLYMRGGEPDGSTSGDDSTDSTVGR